MKNLYQALIVWLMLVAIPFQGFAAASMLACAPVPAMAQAMPAMTAGHCADMDAAVQHARVDSPGGSGHATPPHHADGKCNTCASCCCGAIMAPMTPALHVPGDTPELVAFHFTDGHVARVDLALPERPPKSTLT